MSPKITPLAQLRQPGESLDSFVIVCAMLGRTRRDVRHYLDALALDVGSRRRLLDAYESEVIAFALDPLS